MKGVRLLIAAAVLAALGGFVWWSNKQEAAKATAPDPKAPPKILEMKESDIKKIEIQHKDGETTVLTKDGDKWSITAPQALAADQSSVAGITSLASGLTSDRLVDENATDLASYGLEPPVVRISFTMADGSKHALRIGETTPTGNSVYAKLDGNNRLFTMASTSKTTFEKQAKDLREKHLMTFDQDKLSRVELEAAGKPALEFGKAGMDWQILKPKPMRADGSQVEALLQKLKDASMSTDDDPKQAATAFGSGTRVATAKVTSSEGTQTLEVRKNKDDYYAKSSVVDGVYKVAKDLGDGLNKSVDDFRNKKIFDFGFADPNHIEFKDNGKTLAYDKSGEKWTSGGKTMDTIAIQNLIDKLRDLSASKFVDSGFTTPAIELTVASDDNKRTEKIQIAAIGDHFLARRENDSSLYQIDASAISDLRQAFAGVKEPEAAPAKK